MAQKRQISIAFTQEQHKWLENREEKLGIPKAETVRRALSLVMLAEAEKTPRNPAKNRTIVTI